MILRNLERTGNGYFNHENTAQFNQMMADLDAFVKFAKPEEEDLCIGYLREQVRLIKPKLIVCLGRISAMRLIDPDFRITKQHGQWVKRGAFDMCAVYHPSLLLRDPRRKPEMLIDMKSVKAKLDAVKSEASK